VYPYFVLAHCPFGVAEGVFVGAALGGRDEGDAAMTAGMVAVGSPLADGVLCGSRSSANAMMATTVTATAARTAVPPLTCDVLVSMSLRRSKCLTCSRAGKPYEIPLADRYRIACDGSV
jgi:hypothetical protein